MKIELVLLILALISIGICALLGYKRGAKVLAFLQELSQKIDNTRALVEIYKKEVEYSISTLKEENERFTFEPYYIYVPAGAEIVSDLGNKLKEDSFYLIVFEKEEKGELFNGEGWIDLEKVYKNPQPVLPKPITFQKDTEIKSGPSKGYHTISVASRAEIAEIIDYFGNWVKIKMANGDIGYFCIED